MYEAIIFQSVLPNDSSSSPVLKFHLLFSLKGSFIEDLLVNLKITCLSEECWNCTEWRSMSFLMFNVL